MSPPGSHERDRPLYVNPYLVGAVWTIGIALVGSAIFALFGGHLMFTRAVWIGAAGVWAVCIYSAFEWARDLLRRRP